MVQCDHRQVCRVVECVILTDRLLMNCRKPLTVEERWGVDPFKVGTCFALIAILSYDLSMSCVPCQLMCNASRVIMLRPPPILSLAPWTQTHPFGLRIFKTLLQVSEQSEKDLSIIFVSGPCSRHGFISLPEPSPILFPLDRCRAMERSNHNGPHRFYACLLPRVWMARSTKVAYAAVTVYSTTCGDSAL